VLKDIDAIKAFFHSWDRIPACHRAISVGIKRALSQQSAGVQSLLRVAMTSKRARSAGAEPQADATDQLPAGSSMQGSQEQAQEYEQQPESSSNHSGYTETQGRSADVTHQEQGAGEENKWLYKVVVSCVP
jgi:hypothetical protein